MICSPLARLLALASFALVVSCEVGTDRDRYASGDPGSGVFRNLLATTAYLPGCSVFVFEQLVGDAWRDRGPGVVCFWEGFARPVEPEGELRFEFRAPDEPGTWRLRVDGGLGCLPDQPLSSAACLRLFSVTTDPFEVRASCDPLVCGPPLAMPNLLCEDGESFAGPTGRCLEDVETGTCGWEIASCPDDA